MLNHDPGTTLVKTPGCNNAAGFTLIEVVVALSIFAIGLLAVAALQIRAVGNNTTGRFSMDAMTWTATQFEQFIAQEFDNANFMDTNGNGTAGLDNDTPATADFSLAFPDDGRNTTMFWNVADNPRGFKQIRVITVWQRVGSGPKRAVFDFIKPEDI
jgi:type IV pilus assembly protein PilV